MDNKTICRKISAMLSLYIDNRVTYQERAFIEEHLSNCKECYKKYIYLKSLVKDLKDSYRHILDLTRKKQQQKVFSIREHEKFLEALYPYVDNELEASECMEFRQYLVKSPNAQRQLKNVYVLQKELRNTFDKTQKSFNKDLTKTVIDAVKYQRERAEERKKKVFRNTVLVTRLAKVSVLLGLVCLCGYEVEELYQMHKTSTVKEQQRIVPYSQETSTSKLTTFSDVVDNLSSDDNDGLVNETEFD